MLAFLLLSPLLAQDPGTVTLPPSQWEQMLDASQAAAERPLAPVEVLQIERSIDGSFSRGVFSGTLRTRVWVPPGREVRVPWDQ